MATRVSFYSVENYIHEVKVEENENLVKKRKKIISTIICEELTEKQKLCIELYFNKNLKMSQIAKELGVTKGTVSKHISKAKKCIEKHLKYSDIFYK